MLSSGFAIGPLLWLYSTQLHAVKSIKPWVIVLHFLPFVLSVVLLQIPSLQIGPSLSPPEPLNHNSVSEQALDMGTNIFPPRPPAPVGAKKPLGPLVANYAKFLSMLIYSLFVMVTFRGRKKEFEEFYSGSTSSAGLLWVFRINMALFVLTVVATILLSVSFLSIVPMRIAIANMIPQTLYLLFFVYYSKDQNVPADILQARREKYSDRNDEAVTIQQNGSEEKYRRSGLSPAELEDILQKTKSYIEANEAYLDAEITLDKLASLVNLSKHHLSQTINTMTGGNFYLFINRFRIDAIIRRLETDEHKTKTLLEIAYDCGFNSYTTFYSAFRKVTGKTPREYISGVN